MNILKPALLLAIASMILVACGEDVAPPDF